VINWGTFNGGFDIADAGNTTFSTNQTMQRRRRWPLLQNRAGYDEPQRRRLETPARSW
jgi:hypothetical protein